MTYTSSPSACPVLGVGRGSLPGPATVLATVTRTSSFGLGREETLRGLAGGLLTLKTAWGGGDDFVF